MNATAHSTPTSVSAGRAALKVLVVDDDSFQLELITGILNGMGITHVTVALGGAQALQEVAQGKARFDLLMTDLHMPGTDGFQFMESMARGGFEGALIIVSGQGTEVVNSASLVARLRRIRLLGAIEKPVDRASLSRLISTIA
jgi:CheY-like chemotaxis protein